MLEEMERKNGNICDGYDYSFGGEHEMDNYTYSLYDDFLKIVEIKYTYASLNQPTAKNILWRVTIILIYKRMGERGGLFRAKGR